MIFEETHDFDGFSLKWSIFMKFSIFIDFLTFCHPGGVPGGAEMDPKIGAFWDPWKSEKCKTPTYPLHISNCMINPTYGLKIKRGLNGAPPGGPWGPDSHISRILMKFSIFLHHRETIAS